MDIIACNKLCIANISLIAGTLIQVSDVGEMLSHVWRDAAKLHSRQDLGKLVGWDVSVKLLINEGERRRGQGSEKGKSYTQLVPYRRI